MEIRFHGRGGQGTVVAAKILADAILRSGRGWCQAIPEFGVERRGAPVMAYARVSAGPIFVRSRIYEPDAVVILDPALAASPATAAGLRAGGAVVVNSEAGGVETRWPGARVFAVPARRIALSHGLGPASAPLVNTAVVGAVCAALGLADLASVEAAVREAVPARVEENAAAAREAFKLFEGVNHALH